MEQVDKRLSDLDQEKFTPFSCFHEKKKIRKTFIPHGD